MKPTNLICVLVCLVGFCLSCNKFINDLDIDKLARSAREPNSTSFVAYNNGDTARGSKLQIKKEKYWYMDGLLLTTTHPVAYQNADGYYIIGPQYPKNTFDGSTGGFRRLYHGQISLYSTKFGAPATNPTADTDNLFLYLLKRKTFISASSYDSVKILLSDYQPAVVEFEKRFKPKTKQRLILNDYNNMVAVLKVYDNRKLDD